MEKDAVTHRANEQNTLLREATAKGDKKEAKEIRFKMVAERTKRMYKKLKNCRGRTNTSLSRLEVPTDPTETNYKDCTEWISIDAPKEIDAKLIARNQHHFGQAKDTFPTKPPFSEWVDWGASSHIAELILEGDFTDETLDELTQDLLWHMKRQTDLDTIKARLTVAEWVGKITAWPEGTSTSPSGFHLTHSKALVSKHDLDPDSVAGAALEQKRLQLIQWQVDLLNVAIDNQYLYTRWQTIVNVMILKEEGNFKIHRLRVIHLYEQDYNLLLALKWRQQTQHCSQKKKFTPLSIRRSPRKGCDHADSA